MTFETPHEEAEILSALERDARLTASSLQCMKISGPDVASRFFDVITDAMARGLSAGMRAEIYYVIKAKHFRTYLSEILVWWEKEEDPIASETLTQSLVSLIRPRMDGEQVWESFLRRRTRRHGDELILAKLHQCKSISSHVERYILREFPSYAASPNQFPELRKLSVENEELKSVLSGLQQSKDKRERLDGLGHRMAVNSSGPETEVEVESLEVEHSSMVDALENLATCYNLRLELQNIEDLPWSLIRSLESNEWLRLEIVSTDYLRYHLWARQEDHDILEIWLTRPSGAPIQ